MCQLQLFHFQVPHPGVLAYSGLLAARSPLLQNPTVHLGKSQAVELRMSSAPRGYNVVELPSTHFDDPVRSSAGITHIRHGSRETSNPCTASLHVLPAA